MNKPPYRSLERGKEISAILQSFDDDADSVSKSELWLAALDLNNEIIRAQKIMAEFEIIYPEGFPEDIKINPANLSSQVVYLCNLQRNTFLDF